MITARLATGTLVTSNWDQVGEVLHKAKSQAVIGKDLPSLQQSAFFRSGYEHGYLMAVAGTLRGAGVHLGAATGGDRQPGEGEQHRRPRAPGPVLRHSFLLGRRP